MPCDTSPPRTDYQTRFLQQNPRAWYPRRGTPSFFHCFTNGYRAGQFPPLAWQWRVVSSSLTEERCVGWGCVWRDNRHREGVVLVQSAHYLIDLSIIHRRTKGSDCGTDRTQILTSAFRRILAWRTCSDLQQAWARGVRRCLESLMSHRGCTRAARSARGLPRRSH